LYGPAETTVDSTFHVVDLQIDKTYTPTGYPLPNYRCMIIDEFSKNVIIGQEGELIVGGVGVFKGYLARDDLTNKALIEIDGELFYRTGDLARMDNNGLLYYQGRKDYQIKLHG
jgi:non-ribosomal peptide synthetase component F